VIFFSAHQLVLANFFPGMPSLYFLLIWMIKAYLFLTLGLLRLEDGLFDPFHPNLYSPAILKAIPPFSSHFRTRKFSRLQL